MRLFLFLSIFFLSCSSGRVFIHRGDTEKIAGVVVEKCLTCDYGQFRLHFRHPVDSFDFSKLPGIEAVSNQTTYGVTVSIGRAFSQKKVLSDVARAGRNGLMVRK